MKPICITFAGAVGTSKTPIANYLSYKLNLSVFNKDIVWTEVMEDKLERDSPEFDKRVQERLQVRWKCR